MFCDPAAGLFCVGSLLQAPAVQTAEDAARRSEHIGHLIFLHDSGQIPAVAVITQQADPAEVWKHRSVPPGPRQGSFACSTQAQYPGSG